MVILALGLVSNSQTGYVIDVVEHLLRGNNENEKGFDVAVINWRGNAGLKLVTPKVYCASAANDLIEPMQYIHQ